MKKLLKVSDHQYVDTTLISRVTVVPTESYQVSIEKLERVLEMFRRGVALLESKVTSFYWTNSQKQLKANIESEKCQIERVEKYKKLTHLTYKYKEGYNIFEVKEIKYVIKIYIGINNYLIDVKLDSLKEVDDFITINIGRVEEIKWP